VKQIKNLIELAHHLGTEFTPEAIGLALYKYTDCGPWTMFYFPDKVKLYYRDPLPSDLNLLSCEAVQVGSIVEGSDAEFESELLLFPFSADEFDEAVKFVDEQVSESLAWSEAHKRTDPVDPVQSIFDDYGRKLLLLDRYEYSLEDLASSHPELTPEQVKQLKAMLTADIRGEA
jgi:hypothetical protein